MTTLAEHNHPPMQTCPEGCPVVGSGADLDAYPADLMFPPGQMQVVATDTDAPSTPVEQPVEEPAKKATRKRTTKKAAAAPEPPNDGAEADDPATPPTAAEAVERIAKKAPAKKARKSGQSAAQEEAEKQAEGIDDKPAEAKDAVSEEDWFRAPGFQRMKTAWEGEDKRQMDRVQVTIERIVLETFPEAYALMNDLYDIVREPMTNEHGEEVRDHLGFVVWARHPLTGSYVEDWTALTLRQREDFLFRITTSLFEWEQRSADLWTRAMFSKGMFVEKFSIEYDAPMSGTIDDRNARGNVEAAEDRYFALMNSAVSRKAEALVRTMNNLMLRLRDTLGQ